MATRDPVKKWSFRLQSTFTYRYMVIQSWNCQNGGLNVVSQSTTLKDRIRKWKKSIIPLRKGTRLFFKVIIYSETNFMLSQTKAINKWRDLFLKNVPCHIGVETKISYQRNLHSKKITKQTSSSERLQSSHSSHKAISLTINWLREGVDHWRNLRRTELMNAISSGKIRVTTSLCTNLNQGWTNFHGTATGFLSAHWKICRQIKVNTSKVSSSLNQTDSKIMLAATKLGGSGKPDCLCACVNDIFSFILDKIILWKTEKGTQHF